MSEHDTTETMADVSHTNPYTGETAGRLFSRGPTVVADGGEGTDSSRTSEDHRSSGSEPAATDPDDRTADEPDEPEASETMKDVSHTPPHEADDANRVFERGRDHPVGDDNE